MKRHSEESKVQVNAKHILDLESATLNSDTRWYSAPSQFVLGYWILELVFHVQCELPKLDRNFFQFSFSLMKEYFHLD